MTRLRASVLAVLAALATTATVNAADVWTVGIDNTRQGWNKFESVLTAANVPRLQKLREFVVDDKIDVTPLVVGEKLYVFTMSNTAFIFDVNTGAELARRQLAVPFDPRPDPGQMDRWLLYHNWGITATPVIDVATGTIYATTFGKPTTASANTDRQNMLWILDANTLADKKPPVLIAGQADNGGGGIANGVTTPYQKMRAGLGLLTDPAGNKAVIVCFSINGENPQGPGHGFVTAFDVRGLNREDGFTPTPAIWNVTPGGGAGGVWMSGSGPAIDGADIYLTTGNGMDPGTKPGNFAESFVRLRYTPGAANVNGGKPTLEVADFWGAFSDFVRQQQFPEDTQDAGDADLGSAGVLLIPERGNVIGGGKDGILYNLNKDNLGKNTWDPQFNLPFVATYLPNPPNNAAGLPTTTNADPNWPIVDLNRNLHARTPNRKTFHVHGTPVYMGRPDSGIVFVWGENERIKAYNYNFATKRLTGFRAEGAQFASGAMPAPGGMPGGRLVVSSNGTKPGTGVVWGVYPVQGNANSEVVPGALVAYDATTVLPGNRLKQLFHSDTNPADKLGNFAKYSTPIVANGKVYVGTFSNKVVQYGLGDGTRRPSPAARAPSAALPEGPARTREAPTATIGLADLEPMTLGCPTAALNAAARRASRVPSQGTYQFSYFNIVSNTHHAVFEVHFRSNYADEPELKYCVEVYCQQGWDPKNATTTVTLMSNVPRQSRAGAHVDSCSQVHAPTKRRK